MKVRSIGLVIVSAALIVIETGHPWAAPATPVPLDWPSFEASQAPIDRRLVADIPKMQWWDACATWGRLTRSDAEPRRERALFAFLRAQSLLTPMDVERAKLREIAVGMTECGVFAARGLPDVTNHSTSAAGTSSQLIYRKANIYVYTEEQRGFRTKVVRSFQH